MSQDDDPEDHPDDDMAPDDQNLTESQLESVKKRVRQYPESITGPFEVFVRQNDSKKPINVLLISAEVHQHFKSIKEIRKVSFGKVRMVFAKQADANNVVYNERLSKLYRVYVPSEKVEIDGVIHQAELDLKDIIAKGTGKFKDPRVPSVPVLECNRLSEAQVKDNVKSYVTSSHSIRVTFSGAIIPDYLEIENVLIPVRLYTPKLMLCKKCKKYGHTESMCSNKPRCGKCGELHCEEDCKVTENVCLHCKGNHVTKQECPNYRQRAKAAKARLLQKSKLTYAEMIKSNSWDDFADDNSYSSLEYMTDVDEELPHCSAYEAPKRKKTHATGKQKKSKPQDDGFPKLPPTVNPNPRGFPPGFPPQPPVQAGSAKSSDSSSKLTITRIIEMLSTAFNLDSVWKELLLNLTPILKFLLEKLINSWPLLGLFLTIDG